MRIAKPLWVVHANSGGTNSSIYSVDVHPDGSRFATAGGDNHIRIWALEPVILEKAEADPTISKSLATLSHHEAAVNAVRWSHSGRYLASGSDDNLIILSVLKSGPPPPVAFGSKQEPAIENWARYAVLRGHTMDVVDVAWSPDDVRLASCSIDNTVCIWTVPEGSDDQARVSYLSPLKILQGHSSWVKGVVWDPVGKYLATSGEDKVLIVWRVDDWKEEIRIQKPFVKASSSSSHFRRVSWSPDGTSICCTHAYKSKQNVAAILDRSSGWSNEVDFVGHRKPVTSARFNPLFFTRKKVSEDSASQLRETKIYTCCAIGSSDCAISVWASSSGRPIAVVKDCFDNAVTDLGWSSNGNILIACSLDGTICAFQFSETELGYVLPEDERRTRLREMYGAEAGATVSSALVENPTQLELETRQKKSSSAVRKPSVQSRIVLPASSGQQTRQSITKTKDGRKRVTPMLVSSNGIIQHSTEIASPGTASSSGSRELLLAHRLSGTSNEPASLSSSKTRENNSTSIVSAETVKNDSAFDRTSSDAIIPSKRVRITDTNAPTNIHPKQRVSTAVTSLYVNVPVYRVENPVFDSAQVLPALPSLRLGSQQRVRLKTTGEEFMSMRRSSQWPRSLTSGSSITNTISSVRAQGANVSISNSLSSGEDAENVATVAKFLSSDDELGASSTSQFSKWSRVFLKLCVAGKMAAAGAVSSISTVTDVSVPSNGPTTAAKESNDSIASSTVTCFIVSDHQRESDEPAQGIGHSAPLWVDRVAGAACCASGNASFAAVGTLGGLLYLYSSASGRRLSPPIVLGQPISFLEARPGVSPFLLIVLQSGEFYAWDAVKVQRIHKGTLSTLFTHHCLSVYDNQARASVEIAAVSLTKDAVPVVTLSLASEASQTVRQIHSFAYSSNIESWMRVADHAFAASDFQGNLTADFVAPKGPLARLQAASAVSRAGARAARLAHADDDASMQRVVTRSHLEHQVEAAKALHSSHEYKEWLLAYITFLVRESDIERLRDVIEDLARPIYLRTATNSVSRSASRLGPISGKDDWPELLNGPNVSKFIQMDVLPILSTNRGLQRLVHELNTSLSAAAARFTLSS